jgi:hypothetical protein
MAPATHQPAPSDTQGNVSRQLAVVVVFGGRVAPARPMAMANLTFAALTSRVLIACGSGLAVQAAWTYTFRSGELAPVVPPLPGGPRYVLGELIYH